MSSLDRVRGEFARHNLLLQALLGVLGYGERAARLAEALRHAAEHDQAQAPPPAETHALDLALLGLLGLRERLLAELSARAPVPTPEARHDTPLDPTADAPPLRHLAR